jgi:hypothetical protein
MKQAIRSFDLVHNQQAAAALAIGAAQTLGLLFEPATA